MALQFMYKVSKFFYNHTLIGPPLCTEEN